MKFSIGEMLEELVDAGELIPLKEGYFEDMGGHIVNGDLEAENYFEYYLKNLRPEERLEVIARMLEGKSDENV